MKLIPTLGIYLHFMSILRITQNRTSLKWKQYWAKLKLVILKLYWKIEKLYIEKFGNKHYCIFPLQDQKDLNDKIVQVFPRVWFLQWDTVGPYQFIPTGFLVTGFLICGLFMYWFLIFRNFQIYMDGKFLCATNPK
jgi:hypothetical protein